jgi:arylsulfatase A-like enzyme
VPDGAPDDRFVYLSDVLPTAWQAVEYAGVPDGLKRARKREIEVLDAAAHGKDLADVIRGMTGGRGPDAVIDAVGMEAHGSPV